MAITTGITPTLLEKGLNEVFYQNFQDMAPGMVRSNEVFKFTPLSSGISETDLALAGGNGFEILGEQDEIPRSDYEERGTTLYEIDLYAAGRDLSYKMKLGDRYNAFSDMVGELGVQAKEAQEKNRFAVLRGALTTTGLDEKSLCATDHPLRSGTQSNYVNSAFGYSAVKTAIQLFAEMQNYANVSMSDAPKMLLLPPALYAQAIEELKAVNIAGNANNDINFVSTIFPGLKIGQTPYIGSTKGGSDTLAFLISDRHKMKVFQRETLNTWMNPWQENANIVTRYNAKYAEVAGFSDWTGIVAIGS